MQGGGGGGQDGDEDHEGKGKPRKSVMRKTVDYNCAFLKLVEDRCVQLQCEPKEKWEYFHGNGTRH